MILNPGLDLFTGIGSALCGVMFLFTFLLSSKVEKDDWFAMLVYFSTASAIIQGIYSTHRFFG